MLVHVVARLKLKDGTLNDFLLVAKDLVAASQQEDGCIEYQAYQDSQDPSVVCFLEKWRDHQALSNHETTDHFNQAIPKLVALCIANGIEINKYTEIV